MISGVTSASRRRGRRLLAASAALGLALGLSACTIGESDDDNDGTTAQQTSAAETTTSAEESAAADKPAGAVDELVLTAAEAPDLGLQPVPAEEIAGGLSAIGSLTENIQVEPARCAEFNQDALLEQADPGTMAIQAGNVGETSFAVAVTTVAAELPERATQIEDCPTMTVKFGADGQEVVSDATNTLVDLDAPEGVEDFAAVLQDNTTELMGQRVENGNFMVTGAVRGIGVSVTATSNSGPVSQEVQDAAMDAFTKQVAKIRDAA
ncbi:hypothetical protein HMPREF3086_12685 [Dietzia sp. HMSC21D01]|uniref:DUF5642 domain-containing protein n=1 Tax=Dietzia cinnamea TaxID=321318 RepID=A0AAW5Q5D5_9ACTN|nr:MULTISPECIES: hypothetical protein [Dietzia]MCT1863891.1 hypothetical protein [Dietzia cinnamea]MCT2029712.1 hypothetical protein [Dietzia cinnamea]MCT2033022.1 hypothetical protein [Dietzia cinnamea]MCT2076169.1 hypothetical protein [Dietzia cinnamea]MCT2097008.1 hypothetical protein [Dietzia cinnamea]